MTRGWLTAVSILTVMFGVASFVLHRSDHPLTYDEGDYYLAVQRGFWVNYTDADDIALPEFISMGIAAVRDSSSRAELSDYIRASGSTMLLRHYHPPLAFYPAIALQPFVTSLPLHWQLRLANVFWLLLWPAVLFLLAYRRPEAASPVMLLLPASAAMAMAVVGFNMHLPFGLLLSLFLYTLYLYERFRDEVYLRWAAASCAGLMATVEYGMFVLFFLAVWMAMKLVRSTRRRHSALRMLKYAGLALLFFAVLWPAGVLKLNMLKSWAFVMYIALFRLKDEPVAFDGWLSLILEKWNSSPLELLILLVLLVYLVYRWREVLRRGSLFIASGVLALLLYLQVNPALVYRWYLFPGFAIALFFLMDVASRERALAALRRPLPVMALATLLFGIAAFAVAKPDYSELRVLHCFIEGHATTTMYLPRSLQPQFTPYYPEHRIVSYHDSAFPDMALADSVAQWRRTGLTVLPRAVAKDLPLPDFGTEHYVVYCDEDAR
ncbi:MAG TPA: hypothetical protein PK916_17235 [Bacteroidota bacterium]|nr:hypothetical protein [Bacteroidota bacterium]